MIKRTLPYLILVFLGNTLIAQNETCLTKGLFDNRYASYSPDGKLIVFESNRNGNWGIFIMDENGSNLRKLGDSTKNNRRPSWHPNGKVVLFESIRNDESSLFTLNINSKKEKRIPIEIDGGELVFAAYSPNGKTIAVSHKKSEEQSDIVLFNKKGKLIKKLVVNGKRNFYPKWSNDGKNLVFFSRKDTENQDDEIYRLDLASGSIKRLTNWPKHNFCPSWSTDGRRIAYVTSMENTRPEIFVMNADGTGQMRITNNQDGETLPIWHPLKQKLLITAYRDGSFQICELELGIGHQ